MPYRDHQQKLDRMKEWRKEKIGVGYGKWLYARRKLKYDNEERFRAALEAIAEIPPGHKGAALIVRDMATAALAEARRAEDELGEFTEERWSGEG